MFKWVNRLVMPAFGGLLLFGAFRYNFWLLAVIAIAVLYRRLTDQPIKARLSISFGFAFGFFVPLLSWVFVLGLDVLFLLAALCIVFFLLLALLPIESGNVWNKLEFAVAWAVIELIRAQYPWGGFSWGFLGYSQTSGPLVNYAIIGNTTLVAFVVVLVATLICDFKFFGNFRQHFLAAALLAVGLAFPTTHQTEEIKVGVVQGGVVSPQVPEFARASQVFVHHLRQTSQHAGELRQADLVVWPENSVDLESDSTSMKQQIQRVVDEIGKPFLIGAVRERKDGHPENVVSLWLPRTGESVSYVKNHLVPFGEYIPMRDLLVTHIGRLNQIPEDFARGHGGGVIDVAGAKVGVAICFEVADQPHLTNLVNNGAQLFFAASNNATYLGTNQPAQQFEISRFSAIAHQRTMVVATTSGISGVISASGAVSNRFSGEGGNVFVAKVGLGSGKAFTDINPANRYLFLGVLFVLLLSRRLRSRTKGNAVDGASE